MLIKAKSHQLVLVWPLSRLVNWLGPHCYWRLATKCHGPHQALVNCQVLINKKGIRPPILIPTRCDNHFEKY